jgi:muramoyltetrapeptide carboxypeptidase
VPLKSFRPVHSLRAGARVALVAPAGALRSEEEIAHSIENVRSFGWDPIIGEHALSRSGYLAGTDGERIADLNRALADSTMDAIWCLRGGYGSMRVLQHVDYDALARRPRPVIGFSDVTALHAAIGRICHMQSFHGPTARVTLTDFSRHSLARALTDGSDSCGTAAGARTIHPGRATGRLAGGNLALIAALCGTPFAPDLEDAILVLEDIGEAVYRIDRMLYQLYLSDAFAGCRGIVFGHCTNCPDDATGRSIDDVLRELTAAIRIPCFTGAPIGHVDDQWTIPLGALAELDADAGTLNVTNLADA